MESNWTRVHSIWFETFTLIRRSKLCFFVSLNHCNFEAIVEVQYQRNERSIDQEKHVESGVLVPYATPRALQTCVQSAHILCVIVSFRNSHYMFIRSGPLHFNLVSWCESEFTFGWGQGNRVRPQKLLCSGRIHIHTYPQSQSYVYTNTRHTYTNTHLRPHTNTQSRDSPLRPKSEHGVSPRVLVINCFVIVAHSSFATLSLSPLALKTRTHTHTRANIEQSPCREVWLTKCSPLPTSPVSRFCKGSANALATSSRCCSSQFNRQRKYWRTKPEVTSVCVCN